MRLQLQRLRFPHSRCCFQDSIHRKRKTRLAAVPCCKNKAASTDRTIDVASPHTRGIVALTPPMPNPVWSGAASETLAKSRPL
ncbi:hypothetical protein EJ02DRAFT_92113 [Clathrospora elynae]|uniref:Uncharacterized protein n=1 Tax=Clathrospora elynae TaxID=706981 RepID=A0A6A5T5T0_9PLEO|nr:hypothetical protein EJ02DRAFT_92113 [Clathrospora elynae]